MKPDANVSEGTVPPASGCKSKHFGNSSDVPEAAGSLRTLTAMLRHSSLHDTLINEYNGLKIDSGGMD
jgi:hypothetical protein